MTEDVSKHRRILAVFLPFLKPERIIKIYADGPDLPISEPFALIEKVQGAMTVMAVDVQAGHLGIVPGMKLADARAHVPDLRIFDHDPRGDAALLSQLGRACMRYTPMVSVVPPDILVLDISGCTHFFDHETALAQDVEDRLDHAGHNILWAIASTPDAAMALARHGLYEGAEAQLPVSALDMDDKTHRALERAGLNNMGDLACRPRAALATRFGAELLLRLDRIMGGEDRPINPVRNLGNVTVERRFAEPVTHVDFVQDCLNELFSDAAAQLAERGRGARMVHMLLFRSDGDVAQLGVETGAPTRDAALFKRLLAERVDGLNDPLNPGFGYDMVRLSIVADEPLGARQYHLDGDEDKKGDKTALISQLSTRLGRDHIQYFIPADSHIPEQALLALPALDIGPPRKWENPSSGEPPLRPFHLFDPPQRIKVIAEIPDGPPHRFSWRRKIHHIRQYEGPERISDTWWQKSGGQQEGKGGLTRDYYRVEDAHGRRYWVFCHGLYGREKTNPDWYIHGVFA